MVKIDKKNQQQNILKQGNKKSCLEKVKLPTIALLAISSLSGCKAFSGKSNTNPFDNNTTSVTAEGNYNGIVVPNIEGKLPSTIQKEDSIDGVILRYVAGDRNAIYTQSVAIGKERGGNIGELIGCEVARRRYWGWKYAKSKGMEEGRRQGTENGERSGRTNAFYVNTTIDLVTNSKYVLYPLGENKESALSIMLRDIDVHDKKLEKEERSSNLKNREVKLSNILKEKIKLYIQSDEVDNRKTRNELAICIIEYLNARNIEGVESAFEKNECLDLLKEHQYLLKDNDNLIRLENALKRLIQEDTKKLEKKFRKNPEEFKKVNVSNSSLSNNERATNNEVEKKKILNEQKTTYPVSKEGKLLREMFGDSKTVQNNFEKMGEATGKELVETIKKYATTSSHEYKDTLLTSRFIQGQSVNFFKEKGSDAGFFVNTAIDVISNPELVLTKEKRQLSKIDKVNNTVFNDLQRIKGEFFKNDLTSKTIQEGEELLKQIRKFKSGEQNQFDLALSLVKYINLRNTDTFQQSFYNNNCGNFIESGKIKIYGNAQLDTIYKKILEIKKSAKK